MVDDHLLDFPPPWTKAGTRLTPARLLAHGIAWTLLLAILLFGVPRVELIFADFGVPLPEITIRVIQASHWPKALVSLTVLLLVADEFVLEALLLRGGVVEVRSWSLFVIATPLLIIATTVWALILPLLTIMTHLSG